MTLTRNPHDLYSQYAERGVTADLTPEEAKTLARTLLGEPAYQDRKHLEHDLVVKDVAALYAMANTEEQP